jgi:hypothetical protein
MRCFVSVGFAAFEFHFRSCHQDHVVKLEGGFEFRRIRAFKFHFRSCHQNHVVKLEGGLQFRGIMACEFVSLSEIKSVVLKPPEKETEVNDERGYIVGEAEKEL